MNLIEQLGGYDVAKNTYEKLKTEMTDKQKNNKIFMGALSGLGDELTQYRREHGIYEIGDKVVFKNNWTANNLVLTIGGDGNSIRMDTVLNLSSHFRHATDAEIKANKRLESSL